MDADDAVVQTTAAAQGRRPAPPPEYVLFYRENYRRMVGYVMHAGATRDEAEDVTSETLVQLLRSWPRVENPMAWMRRGLVNNLINKRKSEQSRRARETQHLADTFERPVDHADVWGDPRAVDELLGILTDNQRAVVRELMRGLSQAETADLLGKSYDAVRSTLSEIRRRLERCRPEIVPQSQMSTSSAVRKEAR